MNASSSATRALPVCAYMNLRLTPCSLARSVIVADLDNARMASSLRSHAGSLTAAPRALSVKFLARLDRANFDLRIDGSDLRTCLHAQCAVETVVEARRCG